MQPPPDPDAFLRRPPPREDPLATRHSAHLQNLIDQFKPENEKERIEGIKEAEKVIAERNRMRSGFKTNKDFKESLRRKRIQERSNVRLTPVNGWKMSKQEKEETQRKSLEIFQNLLPTGMHVEISTVRKPEGNLYVVELFSCDGVKEIFRTTSSTTVTMFVSFCSYGMSLMETVATATKEVAAVFDSDDVAVEEIDDDEELDADS